MRKQLRATSYGVICLVIILLTISIGFSQKRRFSGNKEAQPFTHDLPAIEKVELLKLKKQGDLWHGEVEATKNVEGAEAQKIASLWRAQTYLSDSAICHNPGYGIKFYSKDKVIVYASLCWECDNIGFITPDLKRTQGFGGGDEKGQQLLQIFRVAFPQKE